MFLVIKFVDFACTFLPKIYIFFTKLPNILLVYNSMYILYYILHVYEGDKFKLYIFCLKILVFLSMSRRRRLQ